PSLWQPSSGVDLNRQTIGRVYDYYGRLYLQHPRLQWSGMADLIGPSFYSGFLDIASLPGRVRRLRARLRSLAPCGLRRLPRRSREDQRVEYRLSGELGFFETTFVTMQRKIFEDQALMHEAYLGGGLQAIQALDLAGIIDSSTARAWEQIDR